MFLADQIFRWILAMFSVMLPPIVLHLELGQKRQKQFAGILLPQLNLVISKLGLNILKKIEHL